MYILIAKSLNQEATPAEQRELEAWLDQDAANRDIFNEMKGLWGDSDILFQQQEFDSTAAWAKVAPRIIQVPESSQTRTIPFRKWYQVSLAAAAILLIVIAINFLGRSNMETITATGEMVVVTLPDNSTVNLQPGSTLKYDEEFTGSNRKVELEGEAFFDVARDEKKPFIIDANTVDVQVLGTSFYVTTEGELATVAVTTGRVSMTSKEDAQQVILTPGQKGIYDEKELTVVPDTNYNFYKNGVLTFSGVSLDQAISVIANVKNATVVFDERLPAAVRQQLIEISFKNQPLEEILNELCLITNTRWRKDKGQYLIYAK